MKKNNYISLILLFVFSFVLVHNVIPHHHHDEVSEINNHNHDNKQHHDKQHQEEKDHHNENDEPIGLFSHPTHILTSTEFVFSSDSSIKKLRSFNQYFLIADLVIKSISVPIKQKPPNYISAIPLQLFYSAHSLRGPPVFSV